MARKWSNLNLPGALHYVTGNVLDRIQVFRQDECCRAFLKVLKDHLDKWPCKIITYVIMRDHFHLIVNPRDGNIQGFCGALKSLSAKQVVEITGDKRFLLDKPGKDGSIHQVWQESFKAFPLWSGWMIWQKIQPSSFSLRFPLESLPDCAFNSSYKGHASYPVVHSRADGGVYVCHQLYTRHRGSRRRSHRLPAYVHDFRYAMRTTRAQEIQSTFQ